MRRIVISTLAGLTLVASVSACGGGSSVPDKPPPPATPKHLSKTELVERTREKVAKVFVETPLGESSGTAVVIDAKEGLLLTNQHVVQGASTLAVKFNGGHERISAKVVGMTGSPDLALVKLVSVPDNLQAITFANSSSVEVGATVLAIGFEANARRFGAARARASFGFVEDTRIKRTNLGPTIAPQKSLLLTNAATNAGMSGSPLVNANGEAVGLVVLQGDGENQGYAIEADVIREALPGLKAGKSGTGLETVPVSSVSMGEIMYILYGGDGLSRGAARELGRMADRMGGLLVLGTQAGSSADKKGFKLGDVILSMNGLEVDNQTKHARVLDSSTVIKAEGYSIGTGFDSMFDDFTRRVKVK